MKRGRLVGVLLALAACTGGGGEDPGPTATAGEDAGTEDGGSSTEDGSVPVMDGGGGDATPDAGFDADAGPPPGPLSPSYVDFDLNHVLITGQSNAVANDGNPVLSATQPFANRMFNVGVMTSGSCDGDGCTVYQTPSSLVPLVEGDQFFNYAVETSSSGWANEATHLAFQRYEFNARAGYPTKHDVLVSVHGRSGNPYYCLRKGGCPTWWQRGYVWPFTEAMNQVTNAKALATAAGKSYVVRAVATIHGETDHYAPNTPHEGTDGTPGKITSYAASLVEWQADYESSIKGITGQAQPVPLLVTGMSGWTNTEYSQIPVDQLAAHVAAPGKVVLVGPTYQIPNSNDCLHFTNHGERQLGEYLAKVYTKVIFGGQTWEPLRPKNITRAGAVITIEYHVPSPPIVMDMTRVSNPGDAGFKVLKNGSPLAIASVTVSAPDKVQITLAAAPAPGNLVLRYAMQKIDGNQCIGPQNGARGNIRDSDATPSRHGYDLFNWAVQFAQAIP
jgi:hypothetical protein